MAYPTEDAKRLGFIGDKILFRADFITDSSLGYREPRIEFLVYSADKWEHILQTFGFHMSEREAIDLVDRLQKCIDRYRIHTDNLGRKPSGH